MKPITNEQKPSETTSTDSNLRVSTAVMETNLEVAVVDMPNDFIAPMSSDKYNALYAKINELTFDALINENFIPIFTENRHIKGNMKVSCSTPESKQWLMNAVNNIPAIWPGMNLKAIDLDKLSKPKKIIGFIHNCKVPVELVLKMLKVLNPNANIDRWQLTSMRVIDGGLQITFNVDEGQLSVLQANSFRLHFGAGMVRFKDISKKQGEAAEIESGTNLSADSLFALEKIPSKTTR